MDSHPSGGWVFRCLQCKFARTYLPARMRTPVQKSEVIKKFNRDVDGLIAERDKAELVKQAEERRKKWIDGKHKAAARYRLRLVVAFFPMLFLLVFVTFVKKFCEWCDDVLSKLSNWVGTKEGEELEDPLYQNKRPIQNKKITKGGNEQ